jgi:Holliday junction DNA helicase RuvA
MYSHIRGILDRKLSDGLIIDVCGVGYRVFAPQTTIDRAGIIGSELKVFTHTYVREDTLALYGFFTEEDLRMFELLLSVSGVGPKASLAMISVLTPSQFGLAVLTDDSDCLSKAQGVGKKTAQRIILELKDKLKKEHGSAGAIRSTDLSISISKDSPVQSDATSALLMLGYSLQDANQAVRSVYTDEKTLETVIRDALRIIGKSL